MGHSRVPVSSSAANEQNAEPSIRQAIKSEPLRFNYLHFLLPN